jgi:chemotaxis methyl-accepting protein methylase
MSLARLTDHLEKHTGIDMARAGLGRALERYLDKRIPELGLASRDAYVDSLHGNAEELGLLIDVVTVPHSWFFRDIQQWRAVEMLLDSAARQHSVVRVWIPGCATGEDAYTMALIAHRRRFATQITASDINQSVLLRARRGLYNAWAVRDVPAEYATYFHPHGEGHFELDESLRRAVTFTPQNLVEAPLAPREGAWDLILCRNVFIYILRAHAVSTLRRLGQTLRPGGSMMLGASDLVYTLPPELSAEYAHGRLVLRRSLVGDLPGSSLDRGDRGALPVSPEAALPLVERAARAAAETASMAAALNQPVALVAQRGRLITGPLGDPRASTNLVTQANRKFDEGDLTGAHDLYDQARNIAPLAPEPYFFAGVALHRDERFEEAAHRLRGSLFLEPAFWPASMFLALCYERLERPREALLEYERVAAAADLPFRFHAETSLGPDLVHWRSELSALAKRRARSGGAR